MNFSQRSLRTLSRRPEASELKKQATVQYRLQIRQAPGLSFSYAFGVNKGPGSDENAL
jgi:hypothetical protein